MCLNVNIGEFTDISDVLGGVCPAGGGQMSVHNGLLVFYARLRPLAFTYLIFDS